MRLRSVELEVPDRESAVRFFVDTWGLLDAGTRNGIAYLRGTEDIPYIVSIAQAAEPAVAAITFSGSRPELQRIRKRASAAGAQLGPVRDFDEPGSGSGFHVVGPEGHVFRFVTEKKGVKRLRADGNRPLQATHVVLNARDREACSRFAVGVLGFRLSDRTGFMNFVRCDRVHHAIAYAQADNSRLNHIAFEMTDVDAVMRGIGRLKDAGFETFWGPGRHGPGNNVFAYFVAPFGAAIEYTTEVQRVSSAYRTGTPEDWKWPPNRIDHWGVSPRNTTALARAEREFRFRPLDVALARP